MLWYLILISVHSFNNKASLTWDNQRVRSSIEFSPKVSKLTVKSPWKDVTANYKMTGTQTNFQAEALMKWAADTQMSGDLKFDMTNGMKIEFSAETPFYGSKCDGIFLVDYV